MAAEGQSDKMVSDMEVGIIETEQFELEGTFKGPVYEQGHLQLDQVAQSPVQADLECLQECGIHHLTGHPVPMHDHPHC